MAGKRGNGEGSIYQRQDGRWTAVVTLSDGTRKSYYRRTRQEAAQQLAAALRDIHQGLPIDLDDRTTLAQYLTRWLEDIVKPSRRARTHESYTAMVRLHITPSLGRARLATLTPLHVQELLNKKLAAGLSRSTVKYIHAVLDSALGQAVKLGLLAHNAARRATPPSPDRLEVEAFDPEQARRFLTAIRGNRLEALYTVAISVGLRQGEALGLRWQDVDLEAGTVSVRVQLQRIGKQYQLIEPKTRRSRRTIPLPCIAGDALREHRVRQLEERLAAGQDWEDWNLVFPSQRGTPLDAKNVTHRFQAMLKRAGLPRMRFHDLRHACATLLLAQGVHPRVVMETLGHSQIAMTMNTYSHVIPAVQRDAANKLDALLRAAE